MRPLSDATKKELTKALNNEDSAMFISDGKLVSLEVHENTSKYPQMDSLTHIIESYPELKESLNRYKNQTNMKRYTAKELKEYRHDKR